MDFKKFLVLKEFVLLDGAMGTLIQKSGVKYDSVPETLNITHPELIESFHKAYADAGSDIVYANTFGANGYKLKESGYSVDEIIKSGVENAKKAVQGTDCLVALDIGPIGQLLEPAGSLSFDSAYDYFKEQIVAGQDADVIVFETMTDLYELKAAVLAAKENSDKPIIATMTFERNGRTFTGVSPAAMAVTLTGLGVDALGVNCSLGPDELEGVVSEISKYTDLPLVIKANAGLPDPNSNEYDILPDKFADCVADLLKYGVKIIGGCCGTTPEYIAEIRKILADKSYQPQKKSVDTTVCSASTVVEINGPRIIGERINPTGKKLFKQALVDNNIDYILTQALSQVSGGAEILDVNVGHPEIDEKKMMVRVLKAIQSVCDAPLQIDSTKPDVLDSGLRYYNGKPIVNSVNGEEKSLSTVLPLVKKYGASVVGLTLDENGIPKTAEGRFEIAKRIVSRAEELGIDRRDVYIDCLTLTVSAEQDACRETLKALHRVKTELGCKTCLGVSNISFGLPNRELVNRTFLTMALEEGLDLPIINPNVESMTGAVRAYRVLSGIDKNSVEFINAYNDAAPAVTSAPKNTEVDIFTAVYNGLKSEGAAVTKRLLDTTDAMQIVNEMLIPALDRVGDDFEKNKIFLPQLIQSANTAQECFEVIKNHISKTSGSPVSKGKIILATVKGDIHDIGKNIVKVLLDNYGYTVVDLGRDVDPQFVVDTAVEQNIKMIGLSALMTTTLKSMEDTIKLIRQTKELQNPDGTSKCVVFVGGAVLTEDYAMKIGADYYCKDAKESVDTAKRVLG
ncbi:homocysteine S-methyltransferase family protein [Ruminococcus sp.]|uniref:homocysteine S-methyltransferase family protein n=1 Tax=Ruminococcus sp. TaxID=41978 RepID=UPI0025EAD40A|nr:homocysteine S-methyltransferase family protein [Ruminococcus sp.]MCI6615541.1 homocysteine S-methyltransferase family protein [Ruminococcus sp.]